jgi:hypothetical protein
MSKIDFVLILAAVIVLGLDAIGVDIRIKPHSTAFALLALTLIV